MGIFSPYRPLGFALYAMDLYEDALEVANERARHAADQSTRERFRNERTRWLEDNRAERSFPCGVVADPDAAPGEAQRPEPRLNVPRTHGMWIQVIAAVLPSDLGFIRGDDSGGIVEVGRIPRRAILDVDVVDASGVHIPEPIQEAFDPSQLSLMVLRWTNAGVEDEDRFAFRSPWMAWQAARWLIAARQ